MYRIGHHDRRIPRKQWINYNRGTYFITICLDFFQPYFAEIHKRQVHLSTYGHIANRCWLEIPQHFVGTSIDTYIIMPDHVHGIIKLPNVAPTQNDRSKALLCKMIHGFKSSVTRQIHHQCPQTNFRWQRSFYDRLIHSYRQLSDTRKYIINNPAKERIRAAVIKE